MSRLIERRTVGVVVKRRASPRAILEAHRRGWAPGLIAIKLGADLEQVRAVLAAVAGRRFL